MTIWSWERCLNDRVYYLTFGSIFTDVPDPADLAAKLYCVESVRLLGRFISSLRTGASVHKRNEMQVAAVKNVDFYWYVGK